MSGTMKLYVSLMQSVKGTQFLNVISLSLSPACLAAASFSCVLIVMVSLTSMYASL